MRSDDLAHLLAAGGAGELGFRQGTVVNVYPLIIDVAGYWLSDLPVLNAGATALTPGDLVGVLRFRSTYCILGRIGQSAAGFTSAGTLTAGGSQWNSWPSTTSTSAQDLLNGIIARAGRTLMHRISTYVGPNTSGIFTLQVNGTEIASTGTIAGGAAGILNGFDGAAAWPDTVTVGTLATVSVTGRVSAGTGKVAAICRAIGHGS